MKDEITRVAMHLFARKGYAATSMREIADAASVTKAALYHHFPDKETLYREAMASTAEHLCAPIALAAAGVEDPADKVRAIVHAHLKLFMTETDLIRALYHNILMPDSDFVLDAATDEHGLRQALGQCAEVGYLEPDRVKDVFLLLIGAVEYVGVGWLLKQKGPRPGPAVGDRLIAAAIPDFPPEKLRTSARRARPRPRSGSRPGTLRSWLAVMGIGFLGLFGSHVAAQPESIPDPLPMGQPLTLEPGTIDVIGTGTSAMTLAQCVDLALEANNALQAERQGREEVAGQVWQAASVGLPSLDVTGNWTRVRDPSFALDATFGGGGEEIPDTLGLFPTLSAGDIPPQTFWRTDIAATWELNPFLIHNALRAAKMGERRQDTIISGAEFSITEQAMIAFYNVLALSAAVEAVDAEIEQRQEFLDISRRRQSIGMATPLDTLQASVSLRNLIPTRRNAALDLKIAGGNLNVLMGRDADAPITIDQGTSVEIDSVDVQMVIDLALRRPEIQQLEYLRRIQEKNRGAQKAELRPSFSLFGAYGWVAREPEDLFQKDQDSWTASVSLNLPIWDGFLTKGRVKETSATINRIEYDTEEARKRAQLEAEALLGQLRVARENYRATSLNMIGAQQALQSITLRYQNGKSDYLSVLNAQTNRFVARRNVIQAAYDVFSSTASLKRAMGMSPMTSLSEIRSTWEQMKAQRSS